ncbi:MAG: Wzz/FepE/Etk N-terminal domain-containing protein [Thiohalomonadaceae bacterium]
MTTTVQNGLTISETLLALHAWRWKIFAIVLLTVGLGVLHVTITPNTYRADALVQIVRQEPGRPQAREGDIRAVAAEFRKESNVFAETAVIQSRTLLGSVVEQLGLDLVVTPLRPARHQWSALVPSRLLSVLIKGPDRDHAHPHAPVAEFVVATTLLDEPFFLEFDEDGRATLKDAQGTPLGSGPASEPLVLETPDGTIHLAFDQEKVTPNTRYQVMRHSVVSAVDALKKRLKVAEQGEHSGVLRISLDGHDGAITREIVRTIVHTYDELHHQWQSHDIGEALSYLESQMPELAKRAERAETAITIAQRANYSLDIRDEGKRISDRVSKLETEIGKERRKLDLYIPGHPEYAQIEATIARLNEEIHVLRTRLKQLPMLQERMKELARKAGVTS